MANLVSSTCWRVLVLALVLFMTCTVNMAQPMGVLRLEPNQLYDFQKYEQVQPRERKSNNLRNLMRIGRRSAPGAPVMPGFQLRQQPTDYAQFFRPNAAIF